MAALLATVFSSVCFAQGPAASSNLYPVQEGFVDSHGALIYYEVMGRGAPLVIVHGGPGSFARLFSALSIAADALLQAGVY